MRIKKMYQGTVPENKILDTYSTSATDTYSCNYVNELETYSTDETKVGTWIDGKPVYRKVIQGNTSSTDGGTFLTITDSKDLVYFEGYLNSYQNNRIPLNSFHTTTDYCRTLVETRSPISFSFNGPSSYLNKPYIMIVEYTKTTDV